MPDNGRQGKGYALTLRLSYSKFTYKLSGIFFYPIGKWVNKKKVEGELGKILKAKKQY